MYASMVSTIRGRLELVAGATTSNYLTGGTGGSIVLTCGHGLWRDGSREVWELDPVAATFTDRSVPLDVPSARTNHAMAYNPPTGKVYVFGGYDSMGNRRLTTCGSGTARPGPGDRGYSPVRLAPTPPWPTIPQENRSSSSAEPATTGKSVYNDTWEWNSTSREWAQLFPTTSPDALYTGTPWSPTPPATRSCFSAV
jgi:hypothetical protein